MNDSLADTIKPKSDQLNADDLLVSPITVKVLGVTRGPVDQPVHIAIEGQQPYKPCKSMRRVLIAAWGDKGSDWVGKSMTLYCDPRVKYAGVAMGGIRISHLSDIGADVMSIMLTESRGRKSEFVIKKLKAQPAAKPANKLSDIDNQWIAGIKSGAYKPEQIEDLEYRKFIMENVLNG